MTLHGAVALTEPRGQGLYRRALTPPDGRFRPRRSPGLRSFESFERETSVGNARAAAPGRLRVPGDKSISHRALIFGALATGTTRIRGLLEAEDVINTARAVVALGASAAKVGDVWEVKGRGPGGLRQPQGPLDFGNSGTGTRLMMGVIAGHPITVQMTGDASLSRRPMRRVLAPLMQMGLQVLEPGKEIAAADAARHQRSHADRLRSAGAVGAGQKRGADRRTACGGRNDGHRARADARSY